MRWFLALWLAGCAATPSPTPSPPVRPAAAATPTPSPVAAATQAEVWSYEVVARYPHDEKAYTQGLWMDPGGQLWETTGLRKESTFRKVDLKTGKFKVMHRLPDQEFGEGLAFTRNTYYWLTWDTQQCHTYDANLKPGKTFRYEGEGWGLTTDPSGDLWMSNGTDKLVLRNPVDFSSKREIQVTLNGQPAAYLNELEWVEDRIYANVYGRPILVVIHPEDGHIEAVIDFTGLLAPEDAKKADVFNGIAYQPKTKQMWVTGKRWPTLFEVKIRKGP